MNYQTFDYPQEKTSIQLSIFDQAETLTEYMLMIHLTDPLLSYTEQLNAILTSYRKIRREELPSAIPVFQRFFLSDAANQAEALKAEIGEECAVSIIEQPPLDGNKIALWVYLQTDVSSEALPDGLFAVKNKYGTDLWSGSMSAPGKSSEEQMSMIFERCIKQLEGQGASLEANVLRTWIFVQNVDVNYSGVVKARNEVFATQHMTAQTHYIASTGIQGRQADAQKWVQMDVYSAKGLRKDQIQYLYAPTHLNPTYEYGVSFERGVCIHYPDRRRVFISGTASIDNKGRILYIGDVRKQTARLLENVETLLNEAGCSFSDVAQMIVYLRDIADYQTVKQLFTQRFAQMPIVYVHASVCRQGWLVEMECIAIK